MKNARLTGIGLGAAALLGWVVLDACGGTAQDANGPREAGAEDGGLADAPVAPPGAEAAAAQPDACAEPCADAAQDAMAATSDAGDATDGDAGASADGASNDASDGAPNAHERCHVAWPQPSGLRVSASGVQLAADSTGGAYLVITYGESSIYPMGGPQPALDLGVPTPGYQTAVAIVRLDAHCAIAWVHEIGAAVFSNSTDIANFALGVDAQSNLTIVGAFWGSVDLGAGPVSTPTDASTWNFDTYVLRFDPAGNVLFRSVFRSDGQFGTLPSALAVSPSGTSDILVNAGGSVDFGDAPDAAIAPGGPTTGRYLVELDPSGHVAGRTALGPADASAPVRQVLSQIAFDSTGTLWATGDDVDAGGQAVMRLAPSGSIDWQQPIGSATLAAAPAGAVLLDQSTATAQLETIHPGVDGGAPSTQSLPVSLGPLAPVDQVIVQADGDVVLAGPIPGGTVEIEAGVYVSAGPDRIGYRTFDATGNLVASDIWSMTPNQTFGAAAVATGGDVLLAGHTYSSSSDATIVFVARLGR